MNYGWRFVTLYRRQGSRPGKETQKSKMAVWGGLTNSCEKKGSEKQREKERPGWLSSKESACSVGDTGDASSILGWGRFPWGRVWPLQYSCLENPIDRGGWWATVCGVAKTQTWLKQFSDAPFDSQFPISPFPQSLVTTYSYVCGNFRFCIMWGSFSISSSVTGLFYLLSICPPRSFVI